MDVAPRDSAAQEYLQENVVGCDPPAGGTFSTVTPPSGMLQARCGGQHTPTKLGASATAVAPLNMPIMLILANYTIFGIWS